MTTETLVMTPQQEDPKWEDIGNSLQTLTATVKELVGINFEADKQRLTEYLVDNEAMGKLKQYLDTEITATARDVAELIALLRDKGNPYTAPASGVEGGVAEAAAAIRAVIDLTHDWQVFGNIFDPKIYNENILPRLDGGDREQLQKIAGRRNLTSEKITKLTQFINGLGDRSDFRDDAGTFSSS